MTLLKTTLTKPASSRTELLSGRRVPADYPLFVLLLTLLALGLFMVLDASYARATQDGITKSGITLGDPFYFFKQQARWALVGMAALVWGMRFRYWRLSRYGPHAIVLAVFLLLLVMVPPFGVHAHGAARWLKFGPIRVQPSEIAKVCVVVYLAGYLYRRQRTVRSFRNGFLGALWPVLVPAILIVKQPDLGTALTLVATALVMMAVGGARMRHLLIVSTLGLALVGGMAMSHSYSRNRLLSFVNNDAVDLTFGYQVRESCRALKAGGIKGLGPGQGDAKFFHLPAPYTDFIATTVGEEFGLGGSLVMLTLFFLYTLRGLHVAHRCPNNYGVLLGTGLCTMVTIQALLNLSVITGTVPDTGVPLPLFSFGGSSLVLVLFATGLLLSISRWPDLRDIDALLESSSKSKQKTLRSSNRSVRPAPAFIDTVS